MSANGSINQSVESPMSTRPPSPEQPSKQERAQVLRDTYPILTDQEIQRILGPDRSQLSLLAQIKGGALSPRSARNVSRGENIHPKVLHGIIDAMAKTARRTKSLCSQIDLLEQELQTARLERGLSKGRMEAAKADRQVRHLRMGQTGTRTEQIHKIGRAHV